MRRLMLLPFVLTFALQSDGQAQQSNGISQAARSRGTHSASGVLRYTPQRSATASHSLRLYDLPEAPAGLYYRWRQATGVDQRGYTAPDGTVWRLMQSDGIVVLDDSGRITSRSRGNSGHPQKYIWKIEKPRQATRKVWVARNSTTGSLSYLYRQPTAKSHAQFFEAQATVNRSFEVVGLDWVNRPLWSDKAVIVQRSAQRSLPQSIYRQTSENYLPASAEEVDRMRQGNGQS